MNKYRDDEGAWMYGLTEEMVDGMTADELELFSSGLVDEVVGRDFDDIDFDPDGDFAYVEDLWEEEFDDDQIWD